MNMRVTQVAESTPFSDALFSATDVLAAVKEVRARHEIQAVIGAQVYRTTTTATTLNGTLTLTAASTVLQFLTGSASGYSVVLPNATTLTNGQIYVIANTTSNVVSVKNNGGVELFALSQNSIGYLYLQTNTTANGMWVYYQILASSTASGIINYNLTSTTPFSTSSTTDVVIAGFTLTPQAGTYAVWYNASILFTTTPIEHFWSFYRDDVQISDSARVQLTSRSNQIMVDSTMTVATFDGTQAIDVRVRRGTSGTLTVNARSLILVRLGS